jgi:lipopolysaccharide/colanic/teichoic acid biosynthesis glycosyltransferase
MSTADTEIGEVATKSREWESRVKGKDPETDEVATVAEISGSGYEAIKPWLDFALALAMLLISAPIILLSMALMRWTSRGPWIYSQKRLGLGGSIFIIYKIRTMYDESERHTGPTWCLPGDPRITPVGRVLRWTHIDELPQLLNVLRREMSLVGPRPERPEYLGQLERALPNYRERLTVRPGLTGLAQVQQRSDTDLQSVSRKLNYDLCYVERMTLWLDIRLLVGTVLKCLGVPFFWIGRILQLPDPNARVARSALLTNPSWPTTHA